MRVADKLLYTVMQKAQVKLFQPQSTKNTKRDLNFILSYLGDLRVLCGYIYNFVRKGKNLSLGALNNFH
jgi:hypothetical protein